MLGAAGAELLVRSVQRPPLRIALAVALALAVLPVLGGRAVDSVTEAGVAAGRARLEAELRTG